MKEFNQNNKIELNVGGIVSEKYILGVGDLLQAVWLMKTMPNFACLLLCLYNSFY